MERYPLIIANNNKDVSLNAIRHIPTGSAPKSWIKDAFIKLRFKLAEHSIGKKLTYEDLDAYFTQLGKDYAKEIEPQAKYIAQFKPRLINCSFGSENPICQRIAYFSSLVSFIYSVIIITDFSPCP